MRGKGRSVELGSRCCAKKRAKKRGKKGIEKNRSSKKRKKRRRRAEIRHHQAETPIFLFALLGLGDFL